MRFVLRFSILAVIGLAATLLPAAVASAQSPERRAVPPCLPHEQVEEQLHRTYNENKIGHGVSGEGWQSIDRLETALLDPLPPARRGPGTH